MIETKLFEIRDSATFMPVCCIHAHSNDSQERYLLLRTSFASPGLILMFALTGNMVTYDPLNWGDRTKQVAHDYITKHWATLSTGSVIDVEHILGETNTPKISERYE